MYNLMLGGGVVKAYAHLGVLQVLEEEKIPINKIGVVSSGSIPGTFLAYGISAQEITDLCLNCNVSKMRRINLFYSGRGFISFDEMSKWIYEICKSRGRKKHSITYHCCSFVTGHPVSIENPPLKDLQSVIRASCAIPILVKPVEYKKDILVDGALLDACPYDVFINEPEETIISDLNWFSVSKKEYTTIMDSVCRALGILEFNRTSSKLKYFKNHRKKIHILQPEISFVKPFTFSLTKDNKLKLIESGRKAALEFIDDIR